MEDTRSAYRIVLDDAIAQAAWDGIYEDGDQNLVALETNRMTNMTGGRHSDNARSVVRRYLADPEGFRKAFHAEREEERKRNRR